MSVCPSCGAEQAKGWKRNPSAFAYCTSCGVAFRWRAQFAEIADYHAAIAGAPDWDPETPAVVLNAYARFVKRRLRPAGAVLDFGTGTGGFVEALRAQGIDAYGLEPSDTARHAATRQGVHVAASLTDLPAVRWAGATAIEVAEHIAGPAWLRQLYDLLAPGAFIFVTTPNRDSTAARLSGPRWSQMTNPFHIALFNAKALRGMMERAGFISVRLLRTGPVLGRTAAHRAAHAALLLAGRHSSLRMVGVKPVTAAPCA
jgi:SAM-dependent methyltransferase